ncbi:rhoptry protein [Plasmodium yoelii yoelii]|uniref:Rhoptry protein n=1 Tax=Plasmodium yoelii yoelii TaxID=73239 RepID=Q7RNY8_PLAYO|nr:rhoptry protein [Plasmodium yoelii yoelii]
MDKCENDENEMKNNNGKIVYMKDLNKLMQEVEIKNQQNAIVKFVLSTKVPFYVESDVIELKSKEKKKIPIYFDIDIMNTKINNVYEEHLIVNFFENGKRQKYELFGETIYPNIIMNKNFIDFQYILKNLFAQETVEIKNVCNFKVYFKWFFEENNLYEGFSNAFMVNPSRGYLLPFEKKLITITYNSINDNYYNVNMLCSVKNGPVYSLKLIAGYSDIKYTINKKELNFNSHYKAITEDIITIHNTGKIKLYVEIIYSIKFPSLLYTNVNNFFIEPHNSKDIIFYFTAGIPSNITENILIKICNFEEINIKLNSHIFYSILDLNVHDKFDGISNKTEYGKICSENLLEDNKEYEVTYDDNKKDDYLKKIKKLMNNNSVLFEGPICYYEKQKKLLINKLKKLYLNIFLSHKKHIQEILDIYYSRINENEEIQNANIGNMEPNYIEEDNSNLHGEKETHRIKHDSQNDKTGSKNIQTNDKVNNSDENQLSLSNVSKNRYEIITILKKYCSKNTVDSIFLDLLKSFICSQKNDNYILDTFSKMKELVNYEKLYCHSYLNNESILKYLKRIILESNVELKEYYLDVGKLIINEEKECVINIKNISNDKIDLNYNLKECEHNDIILVNYPSEINKNDSAHFKIKIKKNSLEEKSFIEKVYIYLNDNNYYTVNVKFDYVVPDILLYYNQIRFEEIEVKRCVCKINRLINTKNVNIKFKIKNITFYNKKLEYCHLKKKTQIFISPTKGIIKNNSFLDLRIFFEPSKVYKNAKVCVEIFIYHSNIVKTLDIYLNSINDNIVVNPHEITIKPLLFNSGYIYENIKIKNLNNYSKNLHIYKLDNYYKYLESFIYDILVIHNHIYIEKNDDKELFYTNLIYYLIEIYREKIDKIKKSSKIEINGDNRRSSKLWN